MYTLSDEQIDFILDDIRARGVRREDLQFSLLDHVCIIMEQHMQEGYDFEKTYQTVIRSFYRRELREIEEKTDYLLNAKKYIMKKALLLSGGLSAACFLSFSFSKIVHSSLTDFLLFLAFISFIFLFLPLVILVKFNETTLKRERFILVSGWIAGACFFVCMMLKFLVASWPAFLGKDRPNLDMVWLVLWLIGLGVGLFAFTPAYFLSGIRKPETRSTTIAISILLVAFIGTQFWLTNLRPLRHSKFSTVRVEPVHPPVQTAGVALVNVEHDRVHD
ncbi:MAG: hypothetical protein Q8927_09810 [Bacteroidota bacterium]|nr:hypothetical protein [Bacteroidota bacterium]MDP4216487.1 hypothetical protein [Bacteroidota bacterium]MDP4246234.1 hypothetical protein [Bacteroidota bacterium]MDP4260612.1 hypothetical protein [Bacteroidota bacterium]